MTTGREYRLPHSLDATVKCMSDGCHRHVWLPATACPDHGGPEGPWVETDEWGDPLYHFSSGDVEHR